MYHLIPRPLGRGVERQFFGASASCSNPLAEEETFSSPARAGPIGNIESLGPVGGWGYCLFGVKPSFYAWVTD